LTLVAEAKSPFYAFFSIDRCAFRLLAEITNFHASQLDRGLVHSFTAIYVVE
jgi:hypothetical protein